MQSNQENNAYYTINIKINQYMIDSCWFWIKNDDAGKNNSVVHGI